MPELFIWLIVTLTGYRAWRLVGLDSLTEPIRWRLPTPLTAFLACPWCSGFWITLAVFGLSDLALPGGLRAPVLQAVAGTVVVGLVGGWDATRSSEE